MTNFRRAFDERLPGIDSAIESMPGSLDQHPPGLPRPKLKRFFQRFSLLLGRVDKSGAKQPQYLWWEGQQLPDALNARLDQVISNMSNGAGSFVATDMHLLILLQDRLEKAVGTDIDQLKDLAPSIAADLSSSVQQADDLLSQLRVQVVHAEEGAAKVASHRKAAEEAQTSAKEAAERAGEARRTIEQIVSPDGRSRTSLEALARRARERITEIDGILDTSRGALEKSKADSAEISKDRTTSEDLVVRMYDLKKQAEQILNLSSQAGLAASYKAEERALEVKGYIFTSILYASAIATIVIAALYVLPGLQQAITTGSGPDSTQVLVAALLRATVLAPLIYVIYFTTKRISGIETLRMDYAEKAAASLAYSGYRDQMTNDDDLLHQLKGSLLSKFHEHPERLLRPGSMSSSARVKTPGFEAETRINMDEGGSRRSRATEGPGVDQQDDNG